VERGEKEILEENGRQETGNQAMSELRKVNPVCKGKGR